MLLRPLRSTLFPYTTLFRSAAVDVLHLGHHFLVKRVCLRQGDRVAGVFAAVDLLHLGEDVAVDRGSPGGLPGQRTQDRKSTRLNSSHSSTSYAVFCLKKKIT